MGWSVHVTPSPLLMPASWTAFMMELIPAKMPALIARATPNLIFLLSCRFHTIFQGRRARIMSHAPPYALSD